jgi:hypothetical protein
LKLAWDDEFGDPWKVREHRQSRRIEHHIATTDFTVWK